MTLGYGLERYGWISLAEHFFRRAVDAADARKEHVDWRQHAVLGIERVGYLRVRRRLREGE